MLPLVCLKFFDRKKSQVFLIIDDLDKASLKNLSDAKYAKKLLRLSDLKYTKKLFCNIDNISDRTENSIEKFYLKMKKSMN